MVDGIGIMGNGNGLDRFSKRLPEHHGQMTSSPIFLAILRALLSDLLDRMRGGSKYYGRKS